MGTPDLTFAWRPVQTCQTSSPKPLIQAEEPPWGTADAGDLVGDADNGNTYAMTCTVSDGSLTATDTFVITVTAVNDAPFLSNDGAGAVDAGSVTEDDALSITLTATDEEGADVTFSKTSGGSCPTWITLTDGGNAAQTATLTANANQITDARLETTPATSQ